MISYRDVSIREWALSVWILRLASRKDRKIYSMTWYEAYAYVPIVPLFINNPTIIIDETKTKQ